MPITFRNREHPASEDEFVEIWQRAQNVIARPAADGKYYGAEAQAVHDRAVLIEEVLRLRESLHNIKKIVLLHDDCDPGDYCTLSDELMEVFK